MNSTDPIDQSDAAEPPDYPVSFLPPLAVCGLAALTLLCFLFTGESLFTNLLFSFFGFGLHTLTLFFGFSFLCFQGLYRFPLRFFLTAIIYCGAWGFAWLLASFTAMMSF